MAVQFNVCALFFGDHADLAERCLGSIHKALKSGATHVSDVRLAGNLVSRQTHQILQSYADRICDDYRIPVLLLTTEDNRYKYPTMRRLFHHDRPLSDAVMWFDDDSYFDPIPTDSWWQDLQQQISKADLLGQFWLMPIQGNQWGWIQTQPWYNPSAGRPPKRVHGKEAFEFCQGGWWVARSEILRRYNWPIPELRHNGGDSLLGELCRQQGLRMRRFYGGLRINADLQGRHSKSRRRGYSENRVGWDYDGRPLDCSHQTFTCRAKWIDAKEGYMKAIELFD